MTPDVPVRENVGIESKRFTEGLKSAPTLESEELGVLEKGEDVEESIPAALSIRLTT